MNENIDIYADLDEEELKDSEDELKIVGNEDDEDLLEIEALKPTKVKETEIQQSKECEELMKSIEVIREKLKMAENINQTLKKNCSLILTTCKTEIERKDKMISNLRKELDAYLFKKKVPIPSYVKKISQSTQTQNIVFNVAVQTTTTITNDQSKTVFSKMNGNHSSSRKDEFFKDKGKPGRRYEDNYRYRFSSPEVKHRRNSRRSQSRERSKSMSPVKSRKDDRMKISLRRKSQSRKSTNSKLPEMNGTTNNKSKRNVAPEPEEIRKSQRIEIRKNDKDLKDLQKRQTHEKDPKIPGMDLRSKINKLRKSTHNEVESKEVETTKEIKLELEKCDDPLPQNNKQLEETAAEKQPEQQVESNNVPEKESFAEDEKISHPEKIHIEEPKDVEKIEPAEVTNSEKQLVADNEKTEVPDEASVAENHDESKNVKIDDSEKTLVEKTEVAEQPTETKSTAESQSVNEDVEKTSVEEPEIAEKEPEQQVESKSNPEPEKQTISETSKDDGPEKTPVEEMEIDKKEDPITIPAEADVPQNPTKLDDPLEKKLQEIHEPVADVPKVKNSDKKTNPRNKMETNEESMKKESEKILQNIYGKSKMSFTIPKKVKQPEIEKKDTHLNRKSDGNSGKIHDKKDANFSKLFGSNSQDKDNQKDLKKSSKRGREEDLCEDVGHRKWSKREEPEEKSKFFEKCRETSKKRKKEDTKSSRSKVTKCEENNFVQDDTEDLELKLKQQQEILKQLELLDQEDQKLPQLPSENKPKSSGKKDSKEAILLDDGSANLEAPTINTVMEAPCSLVEPSYEAHNNSFLDIFNLSMTPDKAAELSGKQETPMKSSKMLNFNAISVNKESVEIEDKKNPSDLVQENVEIVQTVEVEKVETIKAVVDSVETKLEENSKPTTTASSSNSILNDIFSAINEAAKTPKKNKKDKKKKNKKKLSQEHDEQDLETEKNNVTSVPEEICKETPTESQTHPEPKGGSSDTSKENLNDSNSFRTWENKYKEYHEEIVDGEIVVCIKKKKKSKKHKKDKKDTKLNKN